MITPDYQVDAHTLEPLRTVVRAELGASMAESISVERAGHYLRESLVYQLKASVLAEKLPPERIEVKLDYPHPEAVGEFGCQDDPRWATWWDHLLATYRGRWWTRWFREPRTIMIPVRYRVTMPVTCHHRAQVDVLAAWTYPRANTALPGLGHPVLVADRTEWTATATSEPLP
jgi:hypothetical protein